MNIDLAFGSVFTVAFFSGGFVGVFLSIHFLKKSFSKLEEQYWNEYRELAHDFKEVKENEVRNLQELTKQIDFWRDKYAICHLARRIEGVET